MKGKDFGSIGSGYPSGIYFNMYLMVDPTTKAFLANSMQPLFGFPTFVRFSWSTIGKLIQEKGGVEIAW
jgi:ribonuclease H2 subunit A